jgi:hypothetical protein
MPLEHRFDDLDLREEAEIAKLDEDLDAPTTTVQYTRYSCIGTGPC